MKIWRIAGSAILFVSMLTGPSLALDGYGISRYGAGTRPGARGISGYGLTYGRLGGYGIAPRAGALPGAPAATGPDVSGVGVHEYYGVTTPRPGGAARAGPGRAGAYSASPGVSGYGMAPGVGAYGMRSSVGGYGVGPTVGAYGAMPGSSPYGAGPIVGGGYGVADFGAYSAAPTVSGGYGVGPDYRSEGVGAGYGSGSATTRYPYKPESPKSK